MTIQIHSRQSLEELIGQGFPPKTAVISFHDPSQGGAEPLPLEQYSDRVLRVPLADYTNAELASHGLTYDAYFPEADELAEFVFAAIRDGYDIICQCRSGDGRSAGCAAALREFFTSDGVFVFADFRYHPNQMVFHKIYSALWLSGKK